MPRLTAETARRTAAEVTGCRKNESVTLRWDDIDRTAGEIRLRDSKTGARRIPLKRVRPPSIAIHAVAGSHLIVGTLFGATVSLYPLPGTRGDAIR